MSILIKGMEMPETCYECPCGDNEFYECMATKGKLNYHRDEYGYPDGERQDWCPLIPIPPHGRLIDADALMRDIRQNSESYFADDFAREWVDKQPTIIEVVASGD